MLYIILLVRIYIPTCTCTSASILMYRTKTVIFFYNVHLNSMHDYEINGCGVARGRGLVELRPTRTHAAARDGGAAVKKREVKKRTEAVIERNHWQPGKAVVAKLIRKGLATLS